MNTLILQADWNILKGKLKQTWALLTGDDLDFQDGKTREFLGRIQKKTGEKRAAIKKAKRECEEMWLQIDSSSKCLPASSAAPRHGKVLGKEPCGCML